MSVLSDNITPDEFLLAGFEKYEYGYRGTFAGLGIGVTAEESYEAWNAWTVRLTWRDVKLNTRTALVYCDDIHELFEKARKAVLDISDGILDICRLNS